VKGIPMFLKKSNKPQSRIDSLIGVGTKVEGDITFSGGLRVDGEIKGNVSATNEQHSTLMVSEHAQIEGNLSVSHLVINGTVVGSLFASEFLELQPHARVTGDVQYNIIEIHLGAVVEGQLVHQDQGAVTKATELKLASSN